jgi:acetylornithine/N-succinyldiaminopimelate aminotransferase
MHNDDQRYILNTYKRMPITITKGEGSYVYDDQNNKYLDMFAGIAVNALGHQHPSINKVLEEQAAKYLHLSNYFTAEPVFKLAKRLVENTIFHQVFFTNSGTEAVEASIKLVRKWGRSIHPEKTELISLIQGFHGRSSGGMALTGKPSYEAMFGPLLPGIRHIQMNDLDALESTISQNTCAIYLEFIQGEGGIHVIDPDYLKSLIQLAKTYNVLIVADEIQSGIMRTGKLFSYQHYDIKPDIATIAKAIGGGLPLGVMLVSESLSNVLKPGDHGSTFGGNPLACALGNVVLDEVLKPQFITQLHSNSDILKDELIKLMARYPNIIKEVRGIGMMLGVDVKGHADTLKTQFLNHGILINVTADHVIRLLPPLNISKEDIMIFIKVFHVLCQNIKEA